MWIRIIIWNHDKSQTFPKAWFEIQNHDFNSKSTISEIDLVFFTWSFFSNSKSTIYVVTYILFILFTKKQFIENINLV